MNFQNIFSQVIQEELTLNSPASINIDAIEQIESSGNPNAIGKKGERGATQILNQKTWDMIVKDMKRSYDWDKDWNNRDINKSIGNHYINKIIPGYLRDYKIPDTIETRIAAYNWGIGRLNDAYDEHKEQWINLTSATTTRNYIRKYKKLTGQVDTQLKITKPAQPAKPVQPVQPAQPAQQVIHIVKSGDTLSEIAQQYRVTQSEIQKLNPHINDLNKIKINDKIRIK